MGKNAFKLKALTHSPGVSKELQKHLWEQVGSGWCCCSRVGGVAVVAVVLAPLPLVIILLTLL